MSEKNTGKNRFLILILLLAVSAALITLDSASGGRFRPGHELVVSFLSYPQRGVSSSWRSSRDFFISVFGRKHLAARKAELEMEVSILQERLAELEGYGRENRHLRELLDFRVKPGFEELFTGSIGAEVVGRNPLNWYRTLVLNRGSADGVRAGMAVVGVGGLVGRVVETGSAASVIMLLLDNESRVSAVAGSKGEHGIVAGRGDGMLVMKYLSDKSEIRPGDRVRTSGLGGIFPKGVSVGTGSSVSEQDYGLTVSAEIYPAVDFSRLENVLILRN